MISTLDGLANESINFLIGLNALSRLNFLSPVFVKSLLMDNFPRQADTGTKTFNILFML